LKGQLSLEFIISVALIASVISMIIFTAEKSNTMLASGLSKLKKEAELSYYASACNRLLFDSDFHFAYAGKQGDKIYLKLGKDMLSKKVLGCERPRYS